MKTLKLTSKDFKKKEGNYWSDYIGKEKVDGEADISIEIEANLGWVRFDRLWVKGSIIALAGSGIEAGSVIKAGWGIKAGEGIKAGSGIEAGWGIEAGEGIKAGSGIKAGEDCGIFAGLNIFVSKWIESALIIAKEKPKNIISGWWYQDKK